MTVALQNRADGRKHASSISLRLMILRDMYPSHGDMNKRLESLMTEAAILGGEEVRSVPSNTFTSIQPPQRARSASLEPMPAPIFLNHQPPHHIDLESEASEHAAVGSSLSP